MNLITFIISVINAIIDTNLKILAFGTGMTATKEWRSLTEKRKKYDDSVFSYLNLV
jgi:hypothetical protein